MSRDLIQEVVATMNLENMELTEDEIHTMELIVNGNITTKEEIEKIINKYNNNI